jgi:hypothetical protein
MRTIELGVMITDAAVDEKQTTIFCSRWAVTRGVPTVVGRAAIATP